MRSCASCGRLDAPVIDPDVPCKPGECDPKADYRPETHHDSCPKFSHEVVKLFRPAKMVATPKQPQGELEPKWRREGWKVMKDGRQTFRWKMLCRSCIQVVYEREEHHRDYVKACKAARGDDDRTYSKMLTAQSFM